MNKVISLLALATIFLGGRYASGRERLRRVDLHSWYQVENVRNFNGGLPDVDVTWGNLKDENALGMTYVFSDGSFEIVLDRSSTSERDTREVLRHEICHVAAWPELAHGPRFSACLSRLSGGPPGR